MYLLSEGLNIRFIEAEIIDLFLFADL